MRTCVVVLAIALVVCGCSARAARVPATAASAPVASAAADQSLVGTDWRFVEVAGLPVPAGVTATLHLRPGHASGKAGCNAYGAAWAQNAKGTGTFGAPRSTMMACLTPEGAMQVEHRVFDALERTAKMQVSDGQLMLLDAAGKALAMLAPAPSR